MRKSALQLRYSTLFIAWSSRNQATKICFCMGRALLGFSM
jgi:hypothetical protein